MTRSYLPFMKQCHLAGLPTPVAEFRFAPPRRWRFDWAFVEARIAVECEGGVWVGGRHTRGAGFLRDAEKYNHAAILGWRLIRVTPQQIENGEALTWVSQAFGRDRSAERPA